ncbi:MAG: Hpt domain-containing protein [Gemmatimonadetes bacterium]|nr:Hpt domain-containing protein [Gemmatimonadota bacterium]NNK62468.1 Hpt domain-containing protein [Gemmatimonadota bacterium]
MTAAFIPSGQPEPEFMARIREMFVEGLPDRLARMRRGLERVEADLREGRPPAAHGVEDLFLAAHSLKGTAPSVGAVDVGWESGRLSETAEDWSPENPPDPDQLTRARSALSRVEQACEAYRSQWAAAQGPPSDSGTDTRSG